MLCCTEKHSYLKIKNKQKSKTAVALWSCSVCRQLLCLCSLGWMNFLFCSISLINTSGNTFVSLFSKHLSDTRPVSMALSYRNHNRALRGVLFLKAACPTGLLGEDFLLLPFKLQNSQLLLSSAGGVVDWLQALSLLLLPLTSSPPLDAGEEFFFLLQVFPHP